MMNTMFGRSSARVSLETEPVSNSIKTSKKVAACLIVHSSHFSSFLCRHIDRSSPTHTLVRPATPTPTASGTVASGHRDLISDWPVAQIVAFRGEAVSFQLSRAAAAGMLIVIVPS